MRYFQWVAFLGILIISFPSWGQSNQLKQLTTEVDTFLVHYNQSFPVLGTVKVSDIDFNKADSIITLNFNEVLAYVPIRPKTAQAISDSLKNYLSSNFQKFQFQFNIKGKPLETYIPNAYKTEGIDSARLLKSKLKEEGLVKRNNLPYKITKGLANRHIALWHSHGWYYEPSLKRWEWQRARVFQTVEDILPMAFVLPYIAPMLENAGANVLIPRERDWQLHEVIVDNDDAARKGYTEKVSTKEVTWKESEKGLGFGIGKGIYHEKENPFQMGTFSVVNSSKDEVTATAQWTPEIPEKGEYAVYISYTSLSSSTEQATYTVNYSGGKTEFTVNQKIGGGTWLFLGRFHFEEGSNSEKGSVTIHNATGKAGEVITADAVKFGGGMGNVAREGKVSGYPRFLEASRYYFQYSGIHDTLVYHLNENNDYKDDYQSRGEWVNYLKGVPFGPGKNRDAKGLGIPIDLAVAFHTDAGFTRNDSVVGTLMIHSTAADEGFFPDSVSRMASRDFADMLQTQIVSDLRKTYDSTWVRRGLWDKDYSEAYRPTVPTALLELLSHHNFTDMKFALDPRFRFVASRSIYVAVLKYLAQAYQTEYTIQPLPVSHFASKLTEGDAVKLTWNTVLDTLYNAAVPTGYMVYHAVEDSGFDNGTWVENTSYVYKNLEKGIIHRFKVTAVNEGGESFPSEILSVGIQENNAPVVLVVNGFERVAPPAWVNSPDFMGFTNFIDEGVPDRFDLSFIGEQYDFDPNSPWLDDDAPGHGASHANFETQVIAGNTFNFPYVHGKAIFSAGFSFVSRSKKSLSDERFKPEDYPLIDWIAGEQKATIAPKYVNDTSFVVFTANEKKLLKNYLDSGGNLILTGAYIGTDLAEGKGKNHPDVEFIEQTLKYRWRTNHASKQAELSVESSDFNIKNLSLNTTFNAKQYKVEAPDAIEPLNTNAKVLFRYANRKSAGVGFRDEYGVIALGFPFESVIGKENRNALMKQMIDYLIEDNN